MANKTKLDAGIPLPSYTMVSEGTYCEHNDVLSLELERYDTLEDYQTKCAELVVENMSSCKRSFFSYVKNSQDKKCACCLTEKDDITERTAVEENGENLY